MRTRYDTEASEWSFPISAMTVGFDEPQAPRHRPCGHKLHQIFLVNRGQGVLVLGEDTYTLAAGDLFFLRADEPHRYYGTTEDFSTSWLSFRGEGASRLLAYYCVWASGVYHGQDRGESKKALRELYACFNGEISIPALMAKVYSAVVTFFDEVSRQEYTPAEQIKAFLEQRFAEPLTLAEIFAGYPYAKSKLSKDFKVRYGETVFEMLTRIRLSHAKGQLENDPALKVKDVAAACGFADCSYFCRMYRRAFGRSPKGGSE
ncbi:MAG: AraC family transcriptional regulator [Clostridia bacterium]|nr:AraC family transcriptional regulator [Clostridia bacterium]